MAKIIKRAGMIFFVSVISCLIALGCVITVQVTESSNNGIVNADTQNNIYTSQNNEDSSYTVPKAEVPEVPKSDYEYELGHKANCTNQTTCTCMQDIWNSAVQKSLDTGKNVKVTLTFLPLPMMQCINWERELDLSVKMVHYIFL